MTSAPSLNASVDLGPVTSKNRIVMPPLVVWLSNEEGEVSDAHVDHYRETSGPGLQIVEATAILPEGRLHRRQLGIWSDSQCAGLERIASAIHESGSLAGIQIHHAGGSTSLKQTYGAAPRVPSISADGVPDGARELESGEIVSTVAAFRSATRRALSAGFDVIELHGAHGYLISQFLSPAANRRDDEWGGSASARLRFLLETVRAAREEIDEAAAGSGRRRAALTIRLGICASGSRELGLDEGMEAADAAVAAGADFLDISHAGGLDESLATRIRERARTWGLAFPASGHEADPTLLLAALVRERVNVPVVGVSGIRTVEQANHALQSGICDVVAAGRAILADPGWARKALGDEALPIEGCRECKPRCFWFGSPQKCPSRARLAARGEQVALSDRYE